MIECTFDGSSLEGIQCRARFSMGESPTVTYGFCTLTK